MTETVLERLSRWLERLSQGLAIGGLVGLTGIAIATVVDVLLRWLFSAPIQGLSEVISLSAAVTVASFFPLSLQMRGHATITFLGNWLGPRAAHLLETFSAFLTTAFFAFVVWQFAKYSADLAIVGERTWILQISVAPWWIAVSVLFAISAIVQALILILSLSGSSPIDARPSPDVPQ